MAAIDKVYVKNIQQYDDSTMKSITRRIQKWKLPVGSKVILSGRYVGEEYVFLIRK